MNNLQEVNFLHENRLAKGLTQKQVSVSADITESFYCLIENGQRRPSVAVAKRIADVLGFDWTMFFSDSEQGGHL